jgi:hypothetical protein
MSSLLQRKRVAPLGDATAGQSSTESGEKEQKKFVTLELVPGSFWLTRILFLRYLALIYGVAFCIALHQNTQLIGRRGLTPLHHFLERAARPGDGLWECVTRVPTLFWLIEPAHVDFWLNAVACGGLLLSLVVLFAGAANMVVMAALWFLYTSLVNVGQVQYIGLDDFIIIIVRSSW